MARNVLWTAQRHGQDWDDPYVLTALEWMTSFVASLDWTRRIEQTSTFFEAAKKSWASGVRVPLYDPADGIAWYAHQATTYGDHKFRPDLFEPEAYRIAPLFRRIGHVLSDLKKVRGVDVRVARLMSDGRMQPDDGFYELLVAAAYSRRGWDVSFVPEKPGLQKQQDLIVEKPGSSWAVECKRAGRSKYARKERDAGHQMADAVHALSRRKNRSMQIMAVFEDEVANLDPSYLEEKARRFMRRPGSYSWSDEGGFGVVSDVQWAGLRQVLRVDDISFGSSRMIELLMGSHEHDVDYSLGGAWTAAEGRPFHATSVQHVSLVGWSTSSEESARRKAQHFRGIVGRACEQLPGDRPGAIHVGYEAVGGNTVEGLRHRLNKQQMENFDPGSSQLQVVYGNYFMPEHVTDRNESSAVTETIAWYPAKDSKSEPLEKHMLFVDEDPTPGTHFSS
ncbi:hypothetical protein Rleg_1575 [Rhizobium leguminosarum bv. trifolii WSM1325]|uniref:Uncharacterized protein n=1 Tax=Rhizobium leguminosarum bv. trifolii (strain WSM1325) TaxID=395491 RepID=C6AVQ2_RHILS|nr:hypothetical protein [Rhizobium leguminosarum]ACS55863.1 hypothetical protein Rleg_1575 [Rhizobium leguminosarum bv. trifolii WSM1325]